MKVGDGARRYKDLETGRTLVARYDVRLDWWELLDEETGGWVCSIASNKLTEGLAQKYERLPE